MLDFIERDGYSAKKPDYQKITEDLIKSRAQGDNMDPGKYDKVIRFHQFREFYAAFDFLSASPILGNWFLSIVIEPSVFRKLVCTAFVDLVIETQSSQKTEQILETYGDPLLELCRILFTELGARKLSKSEVSAFVEESAPNLLNYLRTKRIGYIAAVTKKLEDKSLAELLSRRARTLLDSIGNSGGHTTYDDGSNGSVPALVEIRPHIEEVTIIQKPVLDTIKHDNRIVAKEQGFGLELNAFQVTSYDTDVHPVVTTMLDSGYAHHNVRPGTWTPLENGVNQSKTYLSHVNPKSNPLFRTPHYGGTITIQYGVDKAGNPIPTEAGKLMTSVDSLLNKIAPGETDYYEGLGVNVTSIAELKRLATVDSAGKVGLGDFGVPQLMLMLQLCTNDALMNGVPYISAMLVPNFAALLKRSGLSFEMAEGVTLDWTKEENIEYFYRYRNYFLNTSVLKKLGYGSDITLEELTDLAKRLLASRDSHSIDTLQQLAKPRMYFMMTKDLASQSKVILDEWKRKATMKNFAMKALPNPARRVLFGNFSRENGHREA